MAVSAVIDWYSFTVLSTNNPDEVIEKYLALNPSDFSEKGYGIKGYGSCRYSDHIRVFYNGRKGTEDEQGRGTEFMGVYVLLSGEALRQYVKVGGDVMSLMGRTAYDESVHITRVDIAADDTDGYLDISRIIDYKERRQIRTKTRRFTVHSDEKGRVNPARTLYIGSRKSEEFARIYDKAKEQYDPHKQAEQYNSHWIRVEVVLRRERAVNAVRHILDSGKDLGEVFAEVINGFLTFVEDDDSNISRCSVADWWTAFLGTLESVKLFTTRDISHVMEKKLRWWYDNIAPLTSALMDGVGELGVFKMINSKRDKRNKVYDKMVDVYMRDTKRLPMGYLLDTEFREYMERTSVFPLDAVAVRVPEPVLVDLEPQTWMQMLMSDVAH